MKKYSIFAIISLVAIAGVVFWATKGDVSVGQSFSDNTYKTVLNANASSTYPYVIRSGAGVLESIAINRPASSTDLRIYDGTATTTGTLIATIYATSTVMAYPRNVDFGVAVVKGIVLDVPAGFAGDYTVIYR